MKKTLYLLIPICLIGCKDIFTFKEKQILDDIYLTHLPDTDGYSVAKRVGKSNYQIYVLPQVSEIYTSGKIILGIQINKYDSLEKLFFKINTNSSNNAKVDTISKEEYNYSIKKMSLTWKK